MRSTEDLVSELRSYTSGELSQIALVVRFDDDTEFVWANDDRALDDLNEHVWNGGQPVGFMGLDFSRPDHLNVQTKLLDEYKDEEWAEQFLITLLANFGELARAKGAGAGPVRSGRTAGAADLFLKRAPP